MSWTWSPTDLAALGRFLADRRILSGPDVAVDLVGDGHSNLTFVATDGTTKVVVRRPPAPPVPPGAHDVLREAAFVGALGGSDVPVPRLLATAEAGEVIDAPLAVTSYVAGPVVTTATPPVLAQPVTRHQIGESLVDTLAALHAVDWRSTRLSALARPAGATERQLARMRRMAEDDDLIELAAWLERHRPSAAEATIVHNDFRLGNVILAAEPPGRVAAVLDWELATVGDPLLDVGYLLACWPTADEPLTPTQAMATAALETGFPSRADLAARYARTTGRDAADLSWYITFAHWRLAVLYAYSRRRAVDPYYADPALVRSFVDAARHAAGSREES